MGDGFFNTLMNSPSSFLRNEWKQKGGFNFYPVTFGINNRVKKNSDKKSNGGKALPQKEKITKNKKNSNEKVTLICFGM